MPKLCKDCKHYLPCTTYKDRQDLDQCIRDRRYVEEVDLVSGEPYKGEIGRILWCEEERYLTALNRNIDTACGKEGKHWEEKSIPSEKDSK